MISQEAYRKEAAQRYSFLSSCHAVIVQTVQPFTKSWAMDCEEPKLDLRLGLGIGRVGQT